MLKPFDKYYYYRHAVQTPDVEAAFLEWVYSRERRGRVPRHLREDFCGTMALACAWVDIDRIKTATGIDLDPEPLAYGQEHYAAKLPYGARSRLRWRQGNVTQQSTSAQYDLVCALNFSYQIFKNRRQLLGYFASCRKALVKSGILVLDAMGGSDYTAPHEDVTPKRGFKYYWEQASFSPITHVARFYIHFKRPGERKRERVFTYDWRMWSLSELQDILIDAGFKQVKVYWEGSTKRGTGNGIFRPSLKGDHATSWIAYIVALV